MNIKREKFCREYVTSGNATQSAIAAGYSPKTARSQGQRLLTFVDVQNRIKELSGETTKSIADIEAVRKFWSDEISDTSAKLSDRLKASELLAKSYGMFVRPIPLECQTEDNAEREDVMIYLPDIERGGG